MTLSRLTGVRLLTLRVRQEVLEWSGAWWFLLTLVVQAVVGPLIGLFVWSQIYPANPYVLRYYIAVTMVTVMTESFEQHTFSQRIYDGTISHELLRPQPVVLVPIGTNVAMRAWLTIMGAPLVIGFGFLAGASYDMTRVAAAMGSVILAAALNFSWIFSLSLLAFWTQRIHSIVGFGSYLAGVLGGTVAPIAFLPLPWRDVAEVLPFYGIIGLPADIATGRVSGTGALLGNCYQIAWIAILGGAAILLWRAGVRRYTAVGA